MAKRIWFLLYHTFSAAVIAGTIVTRSPNSTMAPNAMKDLDVAVQLFEQAAEQSHRAKIALAVLRRLQEKAHRCYKNADKDQPPSTEESSSPSPDSPTGSVRSEGAPRPSTPITTKQEDDELAIFGGQIRVVTKKAKPRDGRSRTRSRTGSLSTDNPVDSSPSPEAHPSLLSPITRRLSVNIPEQGQPPRPPTLSPTHPGSFGYPQTSPVPNSFFGGSNHIPSQEGSHAVGNAYPEFSTLLGTSGGMQGHQAGMSAGLPRDDMGGNGQPPGILNQRRRPSVNTSANPPMGADWMTGWDFGTGSTMGPSVPNQMEWLNSARSRPTPSSTNLGSFSGMAGGNGGQGIASSSGSNHAGATTSGLPGHSFFQDLDLDFPMGNTSHAANSVQYGSDAAAGHYPQSSQYDIQENAALLGNSDHDMGGPGARTPTPYLMGHPRNGSSPGPRPDVAATAAFLNNIARNGGQPSLSSIRGMSLSPAARAAGIGAAYTGGDLFGGVNINAGSSRLTPGAVELGLSGESRLDAGWIAFMRDCGIFGMDRAPQP